MDEITLIHGDCLEEMKKISDLVSDVEKPQIPGFPALCLTYYKSKKEAHQDIKATYERIGYKPFFEETGFWSAKI